CDDLAFEPRDVEAASVPKLVRGDDLRSGHDAGETRLPRRSAPADADENEPTSALGDGGVDELDHGPCVHRRTVPSAHGEAPAGRDGARERCSRARTDC